MPIPNTSRQLLQKTLGQGQETQVQQTAFDQSARMGQSTQPTSFADTMDEAVANLKKASGKLASENQKLLTEKAKLDLRKNVMSNPKIQKLLELQGKYEQQLSKSSTKIEGKADVNPLAQGKQQGTDLNAILQAMRDVSSDVETRGAGVNTVINAVTNQQKQNIAGAQSEFDAAKSLVGTQLDIAGEGRQQALLPGQLEGQGLDNMEKRQSITGTQPLSQAQRADLTAKLISEGYNLDDATQVAQTYGAGGARTDRHNNPAAFTTDIAKQAGLVEGKDYTVGDPFPNNPNLRTAILIGDPYDQTIKVIDKIGFNTQAGGTRWTYTNSIPGATNAAWKNLTKEQKIKVVQQMYQHEGGNGSLSDPAAIEARRQENLKAKATTEAMAKPPTAAQETVGTYAARLDQAGKVFDNLEQYTSKLNPAATLTQSKLPEFFNFLKSSNFQSLEQAQRNFLNATLRRESGAVISPTEFSEGKKQYFPQPGDKPAVLAQKKANRELVTRSFIQSAGNAYIQPNTSPIESLRSKYNY